MAKQIIVLERLEGANTTLRVLWWFPVTPGREVLYARAGATSAWLGASQGENDDIAAGRVVEHSEVLDAPAGTALGQAQAALVALYAQRYTQFDAESDLAAQFYGSYYDGTSWTMTSL